MDREAVGQVVKDTATAALALATLGGLYLGAASLNAEWFFWTLLAASILWGLIRLLRRLLPSWLKRWSEGRDYPRLLEVSAIRELEVSNLKETIEAMKVRGMELYAEGIAEGRKRAYGELLSATGPEDSLTGIAMTIDSGRLAIAASANDASTIAAGGHWLLRVAGSTESKAILRVDSVQETGLVVLVVDQVRDEQYMSSMKSSAVTASEFPPSLRIQRRSLTDPTSILIEG